MLEAKCHICGQIVSVEPDPYYDALGMLPHPGPEDETLKFVLTDHMAWGQWCKGGGENPQALI